MCFRIHSYSMWCRFDMFCQVHNSITSFCLFLAYLFLVYHYYILAYIQQLGWISCCVAFFRKSINLYYYTALQNVPKGSVDLNRPAQCSQVYNFYIMVLCSNSHLSYHSATQVVRSFNVTESHWNLKSEGGLLSCFAFAWRTKRQQNH